MPLIIIIVAVVVAVFLLIYFERERLMEENNILHERINGVEEMIVDKVKHVKQELHEEARRLHIDHINEIHRLKEDK